jgi:transcriptional regulator
LVADCEGDQLVLFGHFAKANPQGAWLAAQGEVMAVFSGPGAYVSPRHYDTQTNVPTWNYCALHVWGALELIEGLAEKDALQKRLIAAFEPEYAEQWRGLPADYQARMLSAIVPFRLPVQRWELKLKLSQNRSAAERERIRTALAASSRPEDQALAAWMERLGL